MLTVFEINVLRRLQNLDNSQKEHSALLRTIIGGLNMSMEDVEDVLPQQLNTVEELCQKLENPTFAKKLVNFPTLH